jgi:hypothetical protein
MKHRIVIGIISALFAVAVTVVSYAEESEKASPVVTFSSKSSNKYVGDTGVVFYDRPVIQNELNVTLPRGFYANLWYSMALANAGWNTNDGNEFDPTIGWSGDVAGVTLDTGITYFDIRPVGTFGRGDVWQPYLELGKEFAPVKAHTITPYIKTEYGSPVKGNSKEDKGLHLHSGIRHKWQIADALALSQQSDFVFDDGAYGYSRAWVFSHALAVSYAVTDWLNLELGGKVFAPLTEAEDRSAQLFGYAGLKVGF